ncbi:MAG TPA: TonB-dependent receptor [Candidatus Methylomirabilis sp.]|nr:TonB-dependent receptor [Candidatus Methylomirabilis sp.]
MTVAFLLGTVEPSAVLAAPPAGTVAGIAKDALERPVPGAQMRLESGDGQVVGRTTADDQGRFEFTGVEPGTYAVVGEKEGFETSTSVVTVSESAGATADLTLASKQPLDVAVLAKRLEEARMSIQPRIGASTYDITSQAVQNQPGGQNNGLNQVLLQAPGVNQDSSSQGSIHVRNEHANVQYRVNGVILPEGVSLFSTGTGLSPRFASSIDLITGALPAEYGLRTSGIVDIQTKNGAFDPGGYVGMYGGSFSWLQPSFEYGGSQGRLNYYGTGSYLQNGIGISPATPNGPIHDDTRQGFGFGYLEYVLNSTSKVSAIFGTFVGHFQIPNAPGATPVFTVNGISDFDSTKVNENQLEQNYYAVLSYLKAEQDFTFRLSTFLRYSNLRFSPDPLADLMFNGIAQQYFRSNTAGGVQAEGSYKLTDTNTVRAGLIISAEGTGLQTTSSVLPTQDGVQTSDTPFNIFQSTPKIGSTYSVYAQDEWRILPNLTINGGLRFDAYLAYRDEWQISPRLAATWTPFPTTTVHAGFARYFTPPPLIFTPTSTFERFVDTSAAPEVTKNATIKAERAYYLDAGVIQQIIPGLKVGVDGYYKWATNLLDDGQFGAPIVLTPFNYKQGYNWGVEITTSLNLGGFTAYGNLALAQQQAKRVETAQSLFSQDDLNFIYDHYIHTDHSQFLTASAGVSYLWKQTRFSVDMLAGSGLRATVNTPNDSTVPAYQQVNLGITQQFKLGPLGGFEARFDIINVANNNYLIRNGTGIGVFTTQFGPPRGFFAGLKKIF